MATIFPTSPAPQINDEYQGYRYNGTSWDIIGVDLTGDYQTKVASVSSTELGYLDGVTSAVQTQLNAKSPLESPTFTGTVTIPTGASISGYATETYVGTAVSNLVDSAPSTLNTLNELAAALADDANFATTITNALSPIGSVTAYAMDTPPVGWLLCDGTVHNISSYPTLGAGLGSTYGGNGTTTFAVPNLKGRMPVGLDSTQTEFDTRGETGGAKTHTLTGAEIPSHLHSVDPPSTAATVGNNDTNHTHANTLTDPGHLHTIDSYASDSGSGIATVGRENVATGDRTTNTTAGNTTTVGTGITINNAIQGGDNSTTFATHKHSVSVDIASFNSGSTGDGGAHNNLQPYIVMNYIIRAV
jgi:microcystin-dependent protein